MMIKSGNYGAVRYRAFALSYLSGSKIIIAHALGEFFDNFFALQMEPIPQWRHILIGRNQKI